VSTETAAAEEVSKETRTGLDPWKVADLPTAPVAKGMSLLGIIGPGAIILGASIGSGEWLLGPATFVKYGLALLWVTSVAVFLQTVLNTEVIRYTLYTGEPAFTGFMRTKPHSTFWAWFYAILFFMQTGWPGWAGASAAAFFLLASGRQSTPDDATTIYLIGVGAFLVCVAILVFSGKRIERTMEILNWIMIAFILGSLVILCIIFGSGSSWAGAITGFVGYDLRAGQFNFIPEGADWFLLSAFAAYSGAGGLINVTLSNWARDKGFGMGSVVGFIPSAVGGRTVKLAHSGSIFKVTPESLQGWKQWWRIIQADQWGVFFIGALLGMGLPAIMYTSIFQSNLELRDTNLATALANAMSSKGAVFPIILALMSVWVLFKTQLDIMEGMVRAITDILWSGSKNLRKWRGGDVRIIYYTVLGAVAVWGLLALRLKPIGLLQLGANVAGLAMMITSLHILRVNTTFLPVELRPPMWRRVALVCMSVFYGFFVYLWLMGGLIPNTDKGFLFNIGRSLS
jgi:hypothetical protein